LWGMLAFAVACGPDFDSNRCSRLLCLPLSYLAISVQYF
jgi:hypothetical protein